MVVAMTLCALLAGGASPTAQQAKDSDPYHPTYVQSKPGELPKDLSGKFKVSDNGSVEYRIEYSSVPQPAPSWFTFTCSNECKGHVHLVHEQCDFSCDTRCLKLHTELAQAHWEDHDEQLEKVVDELSKIGTVTRDQALEGYFDIRREAYRAAIHRMYKVEVPSFNDTPCSSQVGHVACESYDVTLIFNSLRAGTGPDGRTISVRGPTITIPFGKFVIPTNRLERKDPPVIQCACQVVKEITGTVTGDNPTQTGTTGGTTTGSGGGSGQPTTPTVPPPVGAGPGGMMGTGDVMLDSKLGCGGMQVRPEGCPPVFCNDSVQQLCHVYVECADMNHCEVTCTNPCGLPLTCGIGAGTICEPEDGALQITMVTVTTVWVVPAKQTVTASIPTTLWASTGAPSGGPSGTGVARAVCLQMAKHEPHTGVKYHLRLPRPEEEGLLKLAQYMNQESFTGPWDQVRFWLMTDAPTLAEIKKRMIPGPTVGMYARCLYQTAQITGQDLAMGPQRPCFEPMLLTGQSVDADGTEWLVDQLARIDAKGLARWVSGHPDVFAHLFAPGADKLCLPHSVDIVHALLRCPDTGVQSAGLDFMLNAVPAGSREAFTTAGGLSEASAALMGPDASVVEKALKVAETYGAKNMALGLRNLQDTMPQSLKDAAAALLKGA